MINGFKDLEGSVQGSGLPVCQYTVQRAKAISNSISFALAVFPMVSTHLEPDMVSCHISATTLACNISAVLCVSVLNRGIVAAPFGLQLEMLPWCEHMLAAAEHFIFSYLRRPQIKRALIPGLTKTPQATTFLPTPPTSSAGSQACSSASNTLLTKASQTFTSLATLTPCILSYCAQPPGAT